MYDNIQIRIKVKTNHKHETPSNQAKAIFSWLKVPVLSDAAPDRSTEQLFKLRFHG